MGIVWAIIVFEILVIFHEFGHYVLARINKIKVLEFSIGFGPKICGFTKGDTLYALRAIPFGGACMMQGEDEDDKSEGSFNSKKVWQRILVVLAGPVFNFILAFVFAAIIFANSGVVTSRIGSVAENSPAAEAGIQEGDIVREINGSNISMFKEIVMYRTFYDCDKYELTIDRDGKTFEVTVDTYTNKQGEKLMGINSAKAESQGFFGVLKYGLHEVKYNIDVVLKSLRMLVTGAVSRRDISGPVGMVSIMGSSFKEAGSSGGGNAIFLTMASWIVLLSANLGVMNLLPIPALDGGRFLFLIIEGIRRKPLKREGIINYIGFIVLMGFMVLVLINDIIKLI